MLKWISLIVLGAAVAVGAYSTMRTANARESAARQKREAAEIAEDTAKLEARKAESEQKAAQANENAERARLATAEQQRIAAEADREAKKAEAEKAKHDSVIAQENRIAREKGAEEAEAVRATERAKADAAQAEAAKAKALAEAEAAKAQTEAEKLERERLAAQIIADEAKLWELKALDLASLEKELNDFKKELDARELALRPEKTIKDLANIGDSETNKNDAATLALPENDTSLPKADRILARRQRLWKENNDSMLEKTKASTTARLEKLYVAAARAGRITDAEYYLTVLKSLYPDWKLKPQTPPAEDSSQDGDDTANPQ